MHCQGCWKSINFEEKYSKIISCKYCHSVLEFWWWELSKIWEQSDFIEFPTIFKVGKEIEWNWKEVCVNWQLRYEYGGWFFDKFFVIIDWKEYYIEEDDWWQKLLIDWKWNDSKDTIMDKPVWETVNIWWQDVFVQETGLFKLVNIKWFINSELIPWKEYEYLDWIVDWRMVYMEKEVWASKIRVNYEVK